MVLAIGRSHLHFEVRVWQRRPHQIIRSNRREELGLQFHFPVDIHGESAPGRRVLKGSLVHDLTSVRRRSHPDVANIVDSKQTTPARDCAAVNFSVYLQSDFRHLPHLRPKRRPLSSQVAAVMTSISTCLLPGSKIRTANSQRNRRRTQWRESRLAVGQSPQTNKYETSYRCHFFSNGEWQIAVQV